MQFAEKQNDGFKYLLTVINVLSKYAWVVPLKNKNSSDLVEAFQQIFKQGIFEQKVAKLFEERKRTPFCDLQRNESPDCRTF